MFSKVNIGDWIMCTRGFKDWLTAGKWYQRREHSITFPGAFAYNDDSGKYVTSTVAYLDFDLTNILTNDEYLKMVRKPRFKDVNIGDWIMCTKNFKDWRKAGKWYQSQPGFSDSDNFYYQNDNSSNIESTCEEGNFDLTNILTNEEYEAMIKNDKPKTHAPDVVNNPSHYTSGAIECIDAIRAALGRDGFISHCVGTCIKYLFRHNHKGNSLQDLRKAQWYLNKLISELEK